MLLSVRYVAYLLFAVPFQHSSPGAILSPAHTVSGKVDQNFLACFSFFFTSFVYRYVTRKKINKLKHVGLKERNWCLFCLWLFLPVDLNLFQQQWWAWHQGCKGEIGP